jgi:gliding motility-associated transport system ATP-binding protein
MSAMVELSHLTKHFGPIRAVDDVSFQADRGEVLGFLGPNGAGKSTTMKMITGFLTPDSGTIIVAGDDIARKPVSAKRHIGYLPEGAPLYSDMTPETFLDFVAEVRGFRGQEKTHRVEHIIAQVNLGSVLYQPIETLSKGFKRRVGLAQAILHDPEVLILDEPTDGLDPNQKYEVRTLIRSMAKEKVIILSTHILEEVEAVCSRAIIIAGGKVVADGTPADLEGRSELHNAVTLELLGGEATSVHKVLATVTGVRSVKKLAESVDRVRFRVFPKDGVSLVSSVGHVAKEHGWEVAELHVERGRLDEVFRDITIGQALT